MQEKKNPDNNKTKRIPTGKKKKKNLPNSFLCLKAGACKLFSCLWQSEVRTREGEVEEMERGRS